MLYSSLLKIGIYFYKAFFRTRRNGTDHSTVPVYMNYYLQKIILKRINCFKNLSFLFSVGEGYSFIKFSGEMEWYIEQNN